MARQGRLDRDHGEEERDIRWGIPDGGTEDARETPKRDDPPGDLGLRGSSRHEEQPRLVLLWEGRSCAPLPPGQERVSGNCF